MTVEFDLGSPPVAVRDAATVIVLREGRDGIEVFFVKRRAEIRFMGGAYVFPGGKLDPADCDPAVPCDLDIVSAATRLNETGNRNALGLHIAAARELLEEAGILLTESLIEPSRVREIRHGVDVEKKPLVEFLRADKARLQTSALIPWSRWITPRGESRRFDARFFVTAAPRGVDATHDQRETVASLWLTPSEALARADRQEIVLVPPTYRTVETLAQFQTVASVLDFAPKNIVPIEPKVVALDETMLIVLPGDPLHDVAITDAREQSLLNVSDKLFATRFRYDAGAWRAERATDE